MVIKMHTNNLGLIYMHVDNLSIQKYGDDFWYFQQDQFFSYSNMPYKFNSRDDAEKLIDNIYLKLFENKLAIYDIDNELNNLGISCCKY